MKSFVDIFKNINNKKATIIPSAVRTSHGKYSVGIVCSEKNGKRVTLTSALAKRLKLDDKVFVTAYIDDGFIMFSPSALNGYSLEVHLMGTDKKIAYNAGLVHFLIDNFNLDYSSCVSKSFSDIVFNEDIDNPIAVLNLRYQNQNTASTIENDGEDDA